jgi:hypothetical protein
MDLKGGDMFNLGNNLKRSVEILWKYKVLWIFAFLLALTSGSGGSSNSGSGYRFTNDVQSGQYNQMTGQWGVWMRQVEAWINQNIAPLFATEQQALTTAIWIIVAVVLFAIVVGLLFALVRYPSETAIIRMVDEHETSGKKVKFGEGWKLGWSRRAFRIWVIDLILSIPVILFLALIAGGTFLLITTAYTSPYAMTPGPWIAWVIVGVLLALVLILGMIFLGILRNFFIRAAALEDTSIGESFSRGWQVFTHNAKDTFLVWLTLIGVGIVVGIAMILVFFVLIPVYIILAVPGAVVAAIPGAIGFGIASLFTGQIPSWIIAAAVAIPFFFVIVFSPLVLIGGLVELFRSNNWTLAYRQFTGREVPPAVVETPPALPE